MDKKIYIAFFNGQQVEIEANDLYDAKKKAVKHFKARPSQEHKVHVNLAKIGNKEIVHVADF